MFIVHSGNVANIEKIIKNENLTKAIIIVDGVSYEPSIHKEIVKQSSNKTNS